MVKFHSKANPQGQYYLPKVIREELGTDIDLVCNTKAAIIFSSHTPLELVLKSVEVLAKDLQHRIDMQKQTGSGNLTYDKQ
jgi:hypothetical protein